MRNVTFQHQDDLAPSGGAFAGVWMFDDAENALELRAISSSPANPQVHHAGCPVGEFQVGFIVQQQAPYLTDDVLHDENLNDRQWVERNGIVAFASYPLVAGHRAFGVVGLFARHKLEPDTLEALQIVADGLTQGIARDRAESALRQSQAQLEQSTDRYRIVKRREIPPSPVHLTTDCSLFDHRNLIIRSPPRLATISLNTLAVIA